MIPSLEITTFAILLCRSHNLVTKPVSNSVYYWDTCWCLRLEHRGTLMDELVESMLSVGAWLAPDDGPGVVTHPGAIFSDVLSIGLHVPLWIRPTQWRYGYIHIHTHKTTKWMTITCCFCNSWSQGQSFGRKSSKWQNWFAPRQHASL